nr:hypothetical protein [uncultured Campylobacter sp.]
MEWVELIKIVGAFIGFAASIIAAFIGGYYLSKVELTKSKLKKAEILFELRAAAVREFNEICQEHDPLNLGRLRDGELYSLPKWDEIRKDILKYRKQYGYVFEGDEINDILEKILSLLANGEAEEFRMKEHRYLESQKMSEGGIITMSNSPSEEAYACYEKVSIRMSEANDMMRKYLFEEAKR